MTIDEVKTRMRLHIDFAHQDRKASKVSGEYFYWAKHLQKFVPFVEYEKIDKSIYSWYLQFRRIGIPTLHVKNWGSNDDSRPTSTS